MVTLVRRRRGEFWYLKASSEERPGLFKLKGSNVVGKNGYTFRRK